MRFISYIANFFRAGTIESMGRLLPFIVVFSGSISLVLFVCTILYQMFNCKLTMTGGDIGLIITSLAGFVGLGLGGKYLTKKSENGTTGITTEKTQ